MQDQMLKKKIKLEHRMFVEAKDGESKKSEIMRLRMRVKSLEKFAEAQSSRREKAERLLEKTKTEAATLVANLRKATTKKNEETKRQITRQLEEEAALLRQNHALAKDKEGLEAKVARLKKENAALTVEKDHWKVSQKAQDLLQKNHKELTGKMNMLLSASVTKKKRSPVKA